MSIVYSTVQYSTVQYSIASTNLDYGARWYSYIGGLNLGLCPADGESQRLCFFIHYPQGQDEQLTAFQLEEQHHLQNAQILVRI